MRIGILLLTALLAFQDEEVSYKLPFEAGKAYVCSSDPSGPKHIEESDHAYDFRMPVGTRICAARGGTVVGVKEDAREDDPPSMKNANYVAILHSDGTEATYGNITRDGALVKVRDKVNQGDVIALSGGTGTRLPPHLHFSVFNRRTSEPVPIRFDDFPGGTPARGSLCRSSNGKPKKGRRGKDLSGLVRKIGTVWEYRAFGLAHRYCKDILKQKGEVPEKAEAEEKTGEMQKLARELTARAEDIESQQHPEKVIRGLMLARKEFSGTPWAKDLENALSSVRRHDGFGDVEKQMRDVLKAQARFFQGLTAEMRGGRIEAVKHYETCEKQFPGSIYARLAADRKQRLR